MQIFIQLKHEKSSFLIKFYCTSKENLEFKKIFLQTNHFTLINKIQYISSKFRLG